MPAKKKATPSKTAVKKAVKKKAAKKTATRKAAKKKTAQKVVKKRLPKMEVIAPAISDLTQVSLTECLEVKSLLEIYQSSTKQQYIEELSKYVAPSVSIALQGASIAVQKGSMIVEFTKEGQRLLKAKQLSIPLSGGKKLPQLVNASGKYVEKAKGISKIAKAAPS